MGKFQSDSEKRISSAHEYEARVTSQCASRETKVESRDVLYRYKKLSRVLLRLVKLPTLYAEVVSGHSSSLSLDQNCFEKKYIFFQQSKFKYLAIIFAIVFFT